VPIPLRLIERDPANIEVIRAAIRNDRDVSFDGTVSDVRSLAGAEIAIVNINHVAPYDTERLRLIGAPPGVALICASQDPERLEFVRRKSAALLYSPLTVIEVMRALDAAKDSVLAARMESLASLLASYRAADIRTPSFVPRLPAADSIEWIESDGNYVKIHADDGCHTVRMTMLQAEHEFRGSDIVRAHRKWLVNVSRVCGVRSSADGATHLALPSGIELTIGRAYRSILRDRIEPREFACAADD